MNGKQSHSMAPELMVSQWLNTNVDISLEKLRGRIVVIEAFQMLCPGCVSHGLPQVKSVHDTFSRDRVAVIGLHSVFEHHAAITPISLEAFLFEYGLSFPVAVDQAGDNDIPLTMQAYDLRGTPSLVIVDKQGHLRAKHFGQISDLQLGAEIATLLAEDGQPVKTDDVSRGQKPECDDDGCAVIF